MPVRVFFARVCLNERRRDYLFAYIRFRIAVQ